MVAEPIANRYAALYVRVSTGKQRDNWSVKDQLALARLGESRGYMVEVYEEQGRSGETIERRATMQELLADIERGTIKGQRRGGRIGAIICVATNRLSRDEDIIDTLTIQKICRENDCIVITPEQTYNYAERTDTIFGQIRAIFDADQKQATVKATVRAKYEEFRSTGYAGGSAPYGYQLIYDVPHKDGRPRARLVIHPEHAEVVRQIFDWYVNGIPLGDGTRQPASFHRLSLALNARGLRFPASARANQRSGDGERYWTDVDVRRLLKQPKYVGIYSYGTRQRSRYALDGAAEVTLPNLQIISVALWQAAQQLMAERNADAAKRSACSVHPLLGVLRCIVCGGPMCVYYSPGGPRPLRQERYVNYRCLVSRRSGASACAGQYVAERSARVEIDRLLLASVARLPHLRQRMDASVDQMAAQAGTVGVAEQIRIELADNQTRYERLIDAITDGTLTNDEARAKKLQLLERKERLEARLRRVEQQYAEYTAREDAKRRLLDLPDKLSTMTGAQVRQMLRSVFASTTLRPTGTNNPRYIVGEYRFTPQFQALLDEAVDPSTSESHAQAQHSEVFPDTDPLAAFVASLHLAA